MHQRLFLIAIILGCFFENTAQAASETFKCSQKIRAFDCTQPSQQIGEFEPETTLEIEEFVSTAKMYRVRFHAPDGTEIVALCCPEDLGKQTTISEASNPEKNQKTIHEISSEANPVVQAILKECSSLPIFESFIRLDPSIWEIASSKFALTHSRFGFRWVSSTKNDVARSAEKLRFLGYPLDEATARFKEDKLQEVMLLFFGRGDSQKELNRSEFDSFLKELESTVEHWIQNKASNTQQVGANLLHRKSWFKAPLQINLEWSSTESASEYDITGKKIWSGFRPEFIRLVLTTYDGKTSIAELIKTNSQPEKQNVAKLKDLKERVKHDENGDIYIDEVPMVDQGQKGYCVVASAERLMRYYGLNFDQNQLAKAANSTAMGTNPDEMVKALQRVGRQFSLDTRSLKDFKIENFFKEVENYNRIAKKERKYVITLPTQGLINLTEIYHNMDPGVLRETRLRSQNEKNQFFTQTSESIEKGAPLLWAVTLGFIQETPALPQAFGGHMRLIIGYNKKKSEIIYTDSWGMGHEFKRMSLDDAFFITSGLYSMAPTS